MYLFLSRKFEANQANQVTINDTKTRHIETFLWCRHYDPALGWLISPSSQSLRYFLLKMLLLASQLKFIISLGGNSRSLPTALNFLFVFDFSLRCDYKEAIKAFIHKGFYRYGIDCCRFFIINRRFWSS